MGEQGTSSRAKDRIPTKACDLIMAGGVTSGVIYPTFISELIQDYRLQNIGGTSVGAVAASVAAAAEYRRLNGGGNAGYEVLAGIPDDIGTKLLTLFQPTPDSTALFNMFKAAAQGKTTIGKLGRILAAGVKGHPVATGAGVMAGLAVPQLAIALGLKLGLGWKVMLPILGGGTGLSARMIRSVTKDLPASGFGMCSGLTQPGYKTPALTNWLADLIDKAATGRDPEGEPPLTFGDLEDQPPEQRINLRVMTTNVSMHRPYRLPFAENKYMFDLHDFEQLFPRRVVDYMIDHTKSVPPRHGRQGLRYFPDRSHLPVVVAARMSLSFPILISAVRLYTKDYTRRESSQHLQGCWFSDGGLSSNFPIHLFDKLLTNSPTFGINLEAYDRRRLYHSKPNGKPRLRSAKGKAASGQASAGKKPRSRIRKAKVSLGSSQMPVYEIPRLGRFVVELLNTAKDGHDTLQSTLPRNYERVINLGLRSDEGGLNLSMPPEKIEQLKIMGTDAGKFARNFPTDDHRWDRFIGAMANLDRSLKDLHAAYEDPAGDTESFKAFLERYRKDLPESYLQLSQKQQELAAKLSELGRLSLNDDDPQERGTGAEVRIVPSG